MTLFFSVFGLPVPPWADSLAGLAAMPSKPVAINLSAAPGGRGQHLSRLNLVDQFNATLLAALLDADITSTLVDIIASSDNDLTAARALVLLSELHALASSLMPDQVVARSVSIASIAAKITNPGEQVDGATS